MTAESHRSFLMRNETLLLVAGSLHGRGLRAGPGTKQQGRRGERKRRRQLCNSKHVARGRSFMRARREHQDRRLSPRADLAVGLGWPQQEAEGKSASML